MILSLAGELILAGCLSSVSLAQTPVSFATIQKGAYSGVRGPSQIVIRSADEWSRFWSGHAANRKGAATAPSMDFSTEMVVGIFLGEKSTGGYSVEIVKIESDGPTMRVYYKELKPLPGSVVTQALTRPFHLVKVPKHDASVSFSKETP